MYQGQGNFCVHVNTMLGYTGMVTPYTWSATTACIQTHTQKSNDIVMSVQADTQWGAEHPVVSPWNPCDAKEASQCTKCLTIEAKVTWKQSTHVNDTISMGNAPFILT